MVFKGFSTRVPNEAEQKTRQNLDTLRKLGNLCTNKLLDYGRYVHGLCKIQRDLLTVGDPELDSIKTAWQFQPPLSNAVTVNLSS